jgi:hypothetical protein
MIAEEEKEEAPEPLTLEALSQKMQEVGRIISIPIFSLFLCL